MSRLPHPYFPPVLGPDAVDGGVRSACGAKRSGGATREGGALSRPVLASALLVGLAAGAVFAEPLLTVNSYSFEFRSQGHAGGLVYTCTGRESYETLRQHSIAAHRNFILRVDALRKQIGPSRHEIRQGETALVEAARDVDEVDPRLTEGIGQAAQAIEAEFGCSVREKHDGTALPHKSLDAGLLRMPGKTL